MFTFAGRTGSLALFTSLLSTTEYHRTSSLTMQSPSPRRETYCFSVIVLSVLLSGVFSRFFLLKHCRGERDILDLPGCRAGIGFGVFQSDIAAVLQGIKYRLDCFRRMQCQVLTHHSAAVDFVFAEPADGRKRASPRGTKGQKGQKTLRMTSASRSLTFGFSFLCILN